MKSSRLLFQLAPSTPRTEGTGYGLLPTILKTPSSVETEGGVMEIRPGCDGHYKLRDQIAMLPTPREFCWKDANEDRNKSNLGEIVGTSRGLKLHADFVSWMLGYHLDWMDIDSPEKPRRIGQSGTDIASKNSRLSGIASVGPSLTKSSRQSRR
jgi:hypothetical protein